MICIDLSASEEHVLSNRDMFNHINSPNNKAFYNSNSNFMKRLFEWEVESIWERARERMSDDV